MSTTSDALLHHLRADIELKTQVIKALRAERDRDIEASAEQTALMAGVAAELLTLATNISLLIAEGGTGAVQRAAEKFKAVCADLADYTAARAGQLLLTHKPVNIRQLLSRLASRHAVDVRVAAEIPERILIDETQLTRLLSQFVSEGIGLGARVLEVSSDGAADAVAPRLSFRLCRATDAVGDLNEGSPDHPSHQPSPIARLRMALASALCELMAASRSSMTLTIPSQSAVDQAHTGIFRLAQSEDAAALTSAMTALPSESNDEGESVDLMYLDRQLGSLAPVILARTGPAFIADAQRRMTDLHVAHDSADVKRLHGIVQVWKASALTVGARKLAAQLDAIERQTAVGHLPAASALWQVRGTLDRVVDALNCRRPGLGGHQ